MDAQLSFIIQKLKQFDVWDHSSYYYLKYKSAQSHLESHINPINQLLIHINEADDLINLSQTLDDYSAIPSIITNVESIEISIQNYKNHFNFTNTHDYANVFLEIESTDLDWGDEVLQKYIQWAEMQSFEIDLIKSFVFPYRNVVLPEISSFPTALIKISGSFAYGLLKNNNKTHKKISTDISAEIRIYPEVFYNTSSILPDNLHIDTARSGSSFMVLGRLGSIRLTHLPTGISSESHHERSQHLNKEIALDVLMAKLAQHNNLHEPFLEEGTF